MATQKFSERIDSKLWFFYYLAEMKQNVGDKQTKQTFV